MSSPRCAKGGGRGRLLHPHSPNSELRESDTLDIRHSRLKRLVKGQLRSAVLWSLWL